MRLLTPLYLCPCRSYRNGALVEADVAAPFLPNGYPGELVTPLTLGACPGGDGGLWGAMGDVRLWGSALSAAIVSTHRHSTSLALHPSVASLVAHWRFDDLSLSPASETVADISPTNPASPLTLSPQGVSRDSAQSRALISPPHGATISIYDDEGGAHLSSMAPWPGSPTSRLVEMLLKRGKRGKPATPARPPPRPRPPRR